LPPLPELSGAKHAEEYEEKGNSRREMVSMRCSERFFLQEGAFDHHLQDMV
jgi:hypothetical protein